MQDETNAGTSRNVNDGLTISEIFRVIAVQKWIALIIAAVITVAGTLAIYFGYNRLKQQYIVEFSLVLPGIDLNSPVYTYPDGKIFQYSDMVSMESLSEVKENGDTFANVDVNMIITKGDISVIRTVSEETNEVWYKLSVSAKCFSSANLAADFLKAVVNKPREYVSDMSVSYDVYLSMSLEADDYEAEIDMLISQLEYITGQYKTLVKDFGENVVANGKTLSSQLNELTSYANKNELEILLSQVRNEGILKNADLVDRYKMQKVEYERQLKIAEATLANLLGSSGNSDGGVTYLDAAVIKQQSDLVQTLRQKVDDLDKYINPETGKVDASFENKIAAEYKTLEEFTERLNDTVVELYDKSSAVAYKSAGGMRAEGGMGLVTGFVLSLVVGIVVALIVAYALGKRTLAKRAAANVKKNEPAATDIN